MVCHSNSWITLLTLMWWLQFQDGMITVDEFKQAVMNSCVGRKYDDFPQAMKAFIETNFRMIDINSDGVIGIEEYRYDCVQRIVIEDIKIIDDAFNSLLNVSILLYIYLY